MTEEQIKNKTVIDMIKTNPELVCQITGLSKNQLAIILQNEVQQNGPIDIGD